MIRLDLLLTAQEYLSKGWAPIPIPFKSKNPNRPGWQNERLTEDDLAARFNGTQQNIGVILGVGGLVDVDLDCSDAVALADHFLPRTGAVFGRKSRPRSHRLYLCENPGSIQKFADPTLKKSDGEKTILVEIRGTGHQTIFPPSTHPSGERVMWDSDGEPKCIDRETLVANVRLLACAALLARHWPAQGSRQEAALALAGGLHYSKRIPPDEIGDFIKAVAEAAGDEEAAKRAEAAEYTGKRVEDNGTAIGWPTLAKLLTGDGDAAVSRVREWLGCDTGRRAAGTFHRTDYGNAERLIAQHGEDLRFCHPWSRWLAWDGKRWMFDDTAAVVRMAKEAVRAIYREAGDTADDRTREDLAKWAAASEAERRIAAMISLARSEVPILPNKLDADPWLLNVENGTLDLRTGKLRPHRREDLLTKISGVEYKADARFDLWDRFVSEATGGDSAMSVFLQRAVGYSLTGDIGEEKLFFVHGPAATMKTTFIEAAKSALGDYATTANFEAFIERKHAGGPRNDIARLKGSRLVASVEVTEGRQLAQGLVKMITGGDRVAARFLYREEFEFTPEFKLWLVANHTPEVSDDDDAMWRRILRVPFIQVVPEAKRDPTVKATLKNHPQARAAVLAWAVRGCLDWQADGLAVPRAVRNSTASYREEMDPLRDFLIECCTLGVDKWAESAHLRRDYEEYAKEVGIKELLSPKKFAARLKAHGCTSEKRGGRRGWAGVGVLTTGKECCE